MTPTPFTYRRARIRGVYSDRIHPGGQQMTRTYASGREVAYVWQETDPDTGAGFWAVES